MSAGVRTRLDSHGDDPLRRAVSEPPLDARLIDERGVILAFLDRGPEQVRRIDGLIAAERARVFPGLIGANNAESLSRPHDPTASSKATASTSASRWCDSWCDSVRESRGFVRIRRNPEGANSVESL
jgi:hypothetical protein